MAAVVLSDDVLNALLARPDAHGLPCLQFLKAPPGKPCNCKRDYAASAQRQIEGEHARICAFQLPPERVADLKKALGAEQLIVYMNTPGFPRRAVL